MKRLFYSWRTGCRIGVSSILSYSEFEKQDFFKLENHRGKYIHVESNLIHGNPSYSRLVVSIPTYKRVHLLKEALSSCFNQSFDDFKIVITDNNPIRNDETERYIKHLDSDKIIYYKNSENIGPLANFNRCIDMSDCEYSIMLCSDDLLNCDYLEKINIALENNDDMDMILPENKIVYPSRVVKMKGYTQILRQCKKLVKKEVWLKLSLNDFAIIYPANGPSAIVYKKKAFVEVGGFNPDWHPTGDYIFHIMMVIHKNVYLTTINAGEYRMIENITSENEMRSIFIIQYFYIIQKLVEQKLISRHWLNHYRGGIYYRFKRRGNSQLSKSYNDKEIRNRISGINVLMFIYFLWVWFYAYLSIPFRANLGGHNE